jgi:asparagine synthase (glutamine-hydrolysing)
MLAAMPHRAPDGTRIDSSGAACIGQCLFLTTPEALAGELPRRSGDGRFHLVMHGWLSEPEELRRRLASTGALLPDGSDAELVLKAYETWGQDCVDRIDGDFAFAIWDAEQRRLFAARDRIGAKPFFYHWDGRRFSFASELAALLTLPWVPRELDADILAEHAAFEFFSGEATIWRGLRRLPQAQRLTLDEKGLKFDEYWRLEDSPEIRHRRPQDYVEQYRDLLWSAVRSASRARGPLACEVSGGLDSSAVFAICDALAREGTLGAPALAGYTLDFPSGTPADERHWLDAVAAHLGRSIARIPPANLSLGAEADFAARHAVLPPFSTGKMHDGIHMAATSGGSRVLLDGIGGDDWNDDTPVYYGEALLGFDLVSLVRCFISDCRFMGLRKSLSALRRDGLQPLLPPPLVGLLKEITRRVRSAQPSGYFLALPLQKRLQVAREEFDPLRSRRYDRLGQRAKLEHLLSPFSALRFEAVELLTASEGLERRSPLFARPLMELRYRAFKMIQVQTSARHADCRPGLQGIPRTGQTSGIARNTQPVTRLPH